jgi:hypothetical protein
MIIGNNGVHFYPPAKTEKEKGTIKMYVEIIGE